MYVPSPGTVIEVFVQLLGVSAATAGSAEGSARPHNFTDDANNGKSATPGVSFASGEYGWFLSYESRMASAVAVGIGGRPIVGVIVSLTKRFNESLA